VVRGPQFEKRWPTGRKVKIKVKQSRYRPGVAQRVPGSYASQISWQRHRMVVRLSALRTGHLYLQEIHLVLISVRGFADPRAIVRPEGLCHWKIPMTPSGIEPATCRFVVVHLQEQNKNHEGLQVIQYYGRDSKAGPPNFMMPAK